LWNTRYQFTDPTRRTITFEPFVNPTPPAPDRELGLAEDPARLLLRPLAWAGRQVATLAADHLPAGCSWASEPAPADSRSTARRVSYAVTKGGDTD